MVLHYHGHDSAFMFMFYSFMWSVFIYLLVCVCRIIIKGHLLTYLLLFVCFFYKQNCWGKIQPQWRLIGKLVAHVNFRTIVLATDCLERSAVQFGNFFPCFLALLPTIALYAPSVCCAWSDLFSLLTYLLVYPEGDWVVTPQLNFRIF